jgi:hypothetical protein
MLVSRTQRFALMLLYGAVALGVGLLMVSMPV